MRTQISVLSEEVTSLEGNVNDWRSRIETMQSLEDKRRAAASDAHSRETSELRAANEKMSSELSHLFSVSALSV
jgi:hypothetical protein